MSLHWCRVYGLGAAGEIVATCRAGCGPTRYRYEVHAKLFLGPLLINFNIPATAWMISKR